MSAPTYLKNQKRRIESKYHQAAKRFESQNGLIHWKVTSRFHREPTKTEIIHSKISNLLTQSTVSIERKIKSIRLRSVVSKMSTMQFRKFHPDIIDWIRGRFSGETIRIVVREGKIVEKFFVTPKGNRIRVKRSKLELRLRSIPTIKVRLRLYLRPIRLIHITT